jgi:endonuclease-3
MLGEIKARRGDFDLRFLEDIPLDEAREWLRTLPAVGPKTAACVLLFGLGRPGLPVDTHVHRVAGRLGFYPEKLLPDKAQTLLEAEVPEEDHYSFHILLIKHGRHRCTARSPACVECTLLPGCPAGAEILAAVETKPKRGAKRT